MSAVEFSDVETYDADSFLDNIQDIEAFSMEDFSTDDDIQEAKMAYFTKNLGVPTVIYTTVPIEYPATSPDGVATIFNIQGWKHPMDAFNNIQYSVGAGGGSPIQQCPFFGGIPVTKYEQRCQGIKHCSFASPDIINVEHCEVDFESEIFKQINKDHNENNRKNNTYITFLSSQETQCKFKQNGTFCLGKPKHIRLIEKESNNSRWIIGCTNYKPKEQWHRFIEIDTQKNDIDLLRKLFNGEAIMEENVQQCFTVIARSSRSKNCAYIHHQNGNVMRGVIVEKLCNVKFYKFISRCNKFIVKC